MARVETETITRKTKVIMSSPKTSQKPTKPTTKPVEKIKIILYAAFYVFLLIIWTR